MLRRTGQSIDLRKGLRIVLAQHFVNFHLDVTRQRVEFGGPRMVAIGALDRHDRPAFDDKRGSAVIAFGTVDRQRTIRVRHGSTSARRLSEAAGRTRWSGSFRKSIVGSGSYSKDEKAASHCAGVSGSSFLSLASFDVNQAQRGVIAGFDPSVFTRRTKHYGNKGIPEGHHGALMLATQTWNVDIRVRGNRDNHNSHPSNTLAGEWLERATRDGITNRREYYELRRPRAGTLSIQPGWAESNRYALAFSSRRCRSVEPVSTSSGKPRLMATRRPDLACVVIDRRGTARTASGACIRCLPSAWQQRDAIAHSAGSAVRRRIGADNSGRRSRARA